MFRDHKASSRFPEEGGSVCRFVAAESWVFRRLHRTFRWMMTLHGLAVLGVFVAGLRLLLKFSKIQQPENRGRFRPLSQRA